VLHRALSHLGAVQRDAAPDDRAIRVYRYTMSNQSGNE
jgi:hypothetical protein